MMRELVRRGGWLLAAGLLLGAGCQREVGPAQAEKAAKESDGKLKVCTTFYPTTYFTQRIAGEAAEVECMCPADQDAAFWTPSDEETGRMQAADLIVLNGANFEKGVGKVTLPESRIVDTAKPLADGFIMLKGVTTHSHGPSGSHSHEGIDGHTWLDPINAKVQAEQIKEALAKKRPGKAEEFEKAYAALVKELDGLDAGWKKLSERIGSEKMLCSHPAYNYIGRRYGWDLTWYLLDPEEAPDEATMEKIKGGLAETPARFMLWEAEPTAEIAEQFEKELGLQSVVFSPCESLEAEEIAGGATFFSVMSENMERLGAAFGEAATEEGATP